MPVEWVGWANATSCAGSGILHRDLLANSKCECEFLCFHSDYSVWWAWGLRYARCQRGAFGVQRACGLCTRFDATLEPCLARKAGRGFYLWA